MTPDINTLDVGALEPLTKVLFHFIDPNGLPMANRFFEIQLAESNFVDEDGVLMPKVMYVQTDEEGKYLAKLRESKKPYYVLMEGDTPQDVIAYSFYVPKADYVVRAQDLFIAVPPSEVPYDEEAIRLLTQYKLDAEKAADNAKESEDKAKASEIIAVDAAADAEHSLSLLYDEVDRARAHADASETSRQAADASKAAAKTSETNAKVSETSAANSATTANTAKTAAEAARDIATAKATEAANSAQEAKDSQIAAKTSEDAAKDSQDTAKVSETNSKASELAAEAAANAAKDSEDNAKASETSAASSATIATTKASEASISAAEAKTSETNAKASETAAKASETNAGISATNAASSESVVVSAKDEAVAAKDLALTTKGEVITLRDENIILSNITQANAELAQKWANNPEDDLVEGNEYSSYHWAQIAKRAASAMDPSLVVFKDDIRLAVSPLPDNSFKQTDEGNYVKNSAITWNNETKVIVFKDNEGVSYPIDLSQFLSDVYVDSAEFDPLTSTLVLQRKDESGNPIDPITIDLGELSKSTVTTTSSVTLSGNGTGVTPLKASVRVSGETDNLLEIRNDGLYVKDSPLISQLKGLAFKDSVNWELDIVNKPTASLQRADNSLQRNSNLSDLTNKSTARTNLGLGTAATSNVGTSTGNLMEVGSFGLGVSLPNSGPPSIESPTGFYNDGTYTYVHTQRNNQYGFQLRNTDRKNEFYLVTFDHNVGGDGVKSIDTIFHSGNFNPDNKVDKEVGKGLSSNDYTAAEKTKLSGIATGATKNATDAQLRDRDTHTGEQPISTVTGLQGALDSKVNLTDSRLTDSREWTGATVSQAEAEAGTATTRRAWTAQRVRQAIVAWFNGVSGGIGRTILGKNTASEVRSVLELGSAATRDVGKNVGNVMEVGSFGIGGAILLPAGTDLNDLLQPGEYRWLAPNVPANVPYGSSEYCYLKVTSWGDGAQQMCFSSLGNRLFYRNRQNNNSPWQHWVELYHTGNTTVDGSGFIKQASPIINLYRDKIEQPIDGYLELEDVSFERLGVGHYVLNNCPELATEGWYLEQPKDHNNNIYHTCDWEYDENSRTLTIRTYEPGFENGRFVNGEPKDIERFIALRFSENPSLYPDPDYPEP